MKTVKSPYLCNRVTDFDEIWHGDAYWPPTVDPKFRIGGAVDTSTNRRQGFLWRRTTITEHAVDRDEAAAVNHYFSSSTENIFVPVCLRTPGNRLMLFCDAPSVSQ